MSRNRGNDRYRESPDAEEYGAEDDDVDYYDYDAPPPPPRRGAPPPSRRYAAAPPPPVRRGAPPPARRGAPPPRYGRTAVQPARYSSRGGPPSQWSSPPYLLLTFMGTVIVGLAALIIVLLIQRNNPSTTPPASSGGTSGGTVPTIAVLPTSAAAGTDVPRMPLADFKALYDDPAKRPFIVDVRTSDLYAAGHIPGAISMPEADVDAAYAKIPKDKLVIAYCQ